MGDRESTPQPHNRVEHFLLVLRCQFFAGAEKPLLENDIQLFLRSLFFM